MSKALEKIAKANQKADPWADRLCDWWKESGCTACWIFALFAVGFIGGVIVRGWFG